VQGVKHLWFVIVNTKTAQSGDIGTWVSGNGHQNGKQTDLAWLQIDTACTSGHERYTI
jgi:hypothetical protein